MVDALLEVPPGPLVQRLVELFDVGPVPGPPLQLLHKVAREGAVVDQHHRVGVNPEALAATGGRGGGGARKGTHSD